MLVIRKGLHYEILAFAIISILAATLSSYRLSTGKVLGQQTGEHSSTGVAINGETVEVSIVPGAAALGDKAYSPNPINIGVRDTIVWVNNDTSDTPFHTVTSGTSPDDENKGQEFDSGLTGAAAFTTMGTTFTHTFDSAGEFSYFCQLHPMMIGKIVVS
jgi:plastocyanin